MTVVYCSMCRYMDVVAIEPIEGALTLFRPCLCPIRKYISQ